MVYTIYNKMESFAVVMYTTNNTALQPEIVNKSSIFVQLSVNVQLERERFTIVTIIFTDFVNNLAPLLWLLSE